MIDVDFWSDDVVRLYEVAPETEIGDVPTAFAAKTREFEGEMTDDEVRERYLEALLRRQAGGPQ